MQKDEIFRFLVNTAGGRIILGLLLLLGGWLATETFILAGEQVLYKPLDIPSETVFTVDAPGLDYTVVIGSADRPSKSLLEYTLEDPDGDTVAYESETISRKRRQFTFTPGTAGEYRLKIGYPGGDGGGGHTSLTVRKGDRTVLLRALNWNPMD